MMMMMMVVVVVVIQVAKGMPHDSVPYASCSVMRDAFLASCLYLLDGVIKEEVNQDGVDIHIRMVPFDLPPDEFNTPDAASSKLHLPFSS